MKIKVLGTLSPYAFENHHCPGFLITDEQNKLMLDCGSGCHNLLNFPNDLQNLSIIISHLHRDHYNDIYNLQFSSFVFHNQKRIEKPINIYLPSTPSNKYDDVINEEIAFAKYDTIDENKHIKIGNMNITFCNTNHPVETYAIKIECVNRTIVYTSDTSFSSKDKLVDFSKEADLLICESSLLEEHGFPQINSHLTAKQAGIIAKEANVKGLMLTHFWPEECIEKYVNEAKQVFSKVIPAIEGQIIDLPIIKDENNKDMR